MIGENKKCPLNNNEECKKEKCILFNENEYKCEFKKTNEKKKNYISIGFQIAIGFWLFSIIGGIITYIIIFTFFKIQI